MRLVRDVLDNQLVDRNRTKMGKADGIVIEVRDVGPPRVIGIEAGPAVKARRMCNALARWLGRRSAPYLIPWSRVRDVGIDIDIDVDASDTPLMNVEKRLESALRKIPHA